MARPARRRRLPLPRRRPTYGWRTVARTMRAPDVARASARAACSTSGSSGTSGNVSRRGHALKRVRLTAPPGRGEYERVLKPPRSAETPPMVRALRAPAVRHTLLIILVLNLFVVAIKLIVGVRTNSLSVL